MGDAHRIGVVGLGVISRAYLDTLVGHRAVRVTAVADLDASRSAAVAAELPGVRALSVEELLSSPDVDTVLNLTVPAAHAPIALGAIGHGKHVYGETTHLSAKQKCSGINLFNDRRTINMAAGHKLGAFVNGDFFKSPIDISIP